MQRGPKPQLPSTKFDKGTYQPCRDANRLELVAPDALPQQPDWLTAAGEEVWMDVIGSIALSKMATESDSVMLGNYCNLQGCINMAWRKLASGDPDAVAPPIVAINQVTKMQEYFGIAGAKSRVVKIDKGAQRESVRQIQATTLTTTDRLNQASSARRHGEAIRA
jgi:hypothetical protein